MLLIRQVSRGACDREKDELPRLKSVGPLEGDRQLSHTKESVQRVGPVEAAEEALYPPPAGASTKFRPKSRKLQKPSEVPSS